MSLVKCKECGAQVSTKATACPSCGAVRPKQTRATSWFVALLALFVVGGLVANSNQAPVASSSAPTSPVQKLSAVETEAQKTAAAEKRRQEIQSSCTTGMPELLAVARKLLAEGDSPMASARLNLCQGVSKDPAYLALYQSAERQRAEKNAKIERDEKARKKREGVSIGMSKEDVLASSWGKPQKINTTTTARTVREQWVYPGYNYLYFVDEKLTSVQN